MKDANSTSENELDHYEASKRLSNDSRMQTVLEYLAKQKLNGSSAEFVGKNC